tara:strand:+ start:447 stop:962 length:516 start_codon:yes stop_codon:yes gene_type:complete
MTSINSTTINQMKLDKTFSKVDFEHPDFLLGQIGEATTLTKLIEIFPNTKKDADFWSVFDYYVEDENGELEMLIEVKTRRCSKTAYKSLAFGKNKFDYAKKEKKKNPKLRIIVCWLLNDDNLYFWEYNGKNSKDFYVGEIGNTKQNQKPSPSIMVYTDKIKLLNHHNILSA